MTSIENLKQTIESLSPADHAALRAWFDEREEREERLFDEKIESTVTAGKLDRIVAEVQANIKAGLGEKF